MQCCAPEMLLSTLSECVCVGGGGGTGNRGQYRGLTRHTVRPYNTCHHARLFVNS